MKPKQKESYWLPTARSPWAVIYWVWEDAEWRFLGFREKRSEARRLAEFIRKGNFCKARVVRAMIPLR